MPRFTTPLATIATIAVAALAAACSDASTPVQPSPSASTPTLSTTAAPVTRLVVLSDVCDRSSFDKILGAGACRRDGAGLTWEGFIRQLTARGFAEAWRITPGALELNPGEVLLTVNRGGEVHTFTEVEKFGGGIVPRLNELSHNAWVAPECQALSASSFIPPHGTQRDEVHGTELYQCCIHPWMRMVASVKKT